MVYDSTVSQAVNVAIIDEQWSVSLRYNDFHITVLSDWQPGGLEETPGQVIAFHSWESNQPLNATTACL